MARSMAHTAVSDTTLVNTLVNTTIVRVAATAAQASCDVAMCTPEATHAKECADGAVNQTPPAAEATAVGESADPTEEPTDMAPGDGAVAVAVATQTSSPPPMDTWPTVRDADSQTVVEADAAVKKDSSSAAEGRGGPQGGAGVCMIPPYPLGSCAGPLWPAGAVCGKWKDGVFGLVSFSLFLCWWAVWMPCAYHRYTQLDNCLLEKKTRLHIAFVMCPCPRCRYIFPPSTATTANPHHRAAHGSARPPYAAALPQGMPAAWKRLLPRRAGGLAGARSKGKGQGHTVHDAGTG